MPKILSRRKIEMLEQLLQRASNPNNKIILFQKDSYGRCTIENMDMPYSSKIFKTKKAMYSYFTSLYGNNVIFICDDL